MQKQFTKELLALALLTLVFLQTSVVKAQVYSHSFSSGSVSGNDYNSAPDALVSGLTVGSPQWTGTGAFTGTPFIGNCSGNNNLGMAVPNAGSQRTLTLSLTVNPGYTLNLTGISMNFTSGINNGGFYIEVNGNTYYTNFLIQNACPGLSVVQSSPLTLTGNVSIVVRAFNSGSGPSSFTIDDFTINGTVSSTANVWTGSVNDNWNLNSNWSLSSVPTSSDDAVIPTTTNTPKIYLGQNGTCKSLTISGSTGLITLGTLSVANAITHTGSGTIFLDRSSIADGNIRYGAGMTYTQSGSGQVRMLFDQSNTNAGYRNLGPVVQGQTVNSLQAGGFSIQGATGVDCYYNYTPYPNVQRYVETHGVLNNGDWNERWVSYTNPSSALTAGVGYTVRPDATATFQMDFNGSKFNSGTINVPVTNSTSGTGQGWNFLSNPYPTFLSLPTFLTTNGQGAAYVFHATGQFTGNWGSCNASGVLAGSLPVQNIHPAQGFFVQVPSSGSVNYTQSMISNSQASDFQKTDALNNEVRINLSNGTLSNNIVAYTEPGATAGFDFGKDVRPFVASSSIEMSFVQNSDNFTINALENIDANTELPFNFTVFTNGNYVLELSAYNVNGLTPYLKDNQNNTFTDLSLGKKVTLSLAAGTTVNGRYSIVFKTNTTGIIENNLVASVFANKTNLFIQRTNATPANVQIFNTLGQELLSKEVSQTNNVISLDQFSTECLIVKLTEGTKVQTTRILIAK